MRSLTDDERPDWRTTRLAAGLVVETVAAPPRPDAATEREVERIWTAARRTAPRLFNGRIFSAASVAPDRITGWWTEYRYALAQMRAPGLLGETPIRALAVNGVIRTPDGIVFGRRDSTAIYQPGLWQCPPAGSVEARDGEETVDLRAQLAAELEEELGLGWDAITSVRVLAAVEHPGSRVIDVGFELATALSGEAVAAAHRKGGNAEYDRLAVIPDAALGDWLATRGNAVVETARRFVALLGASA